MNPQNSIRDSEGRVAACPLCDAEVEVWPGGDGLCDRCFSATTSRYPCPSETSAPREASVLLAELEAAFEGRPGGEGVAAVVGGWRAEERLRVRRRLLWAAGRGGEAAAAPAVARAAAALVECMRLQSAEPAGVMALVLALQSSGSGLEAVVARAAEMLRGARDDLSGAFAQALGLWLERLADAVPGPGRALLYEHARHLLAERW